MYSRIEIINEKKLIGKRLRMSFANYRVAELWQSFMPRRKDIQNNVTSELISLVKYSPGHFENFQLTNEFERWAAVEVTDFENIPNELESLILPSGKYAVFIHRGDAAEIDRTFQYILGTWLPNSDYVLDDRPHFEVLTERYKNNDPNSEEEIWIPIRAI